MEAGTRAAEIGVRAILWSCCLAAFAIGANGTAIMAALPTMRGALGLGPSGVEWAVNAYLLVSAAAIVLGGEAADRFGARTVSIAGLVLFGAASGIIALSDNAAMLLAGRTLQGLAAALVVPSTLAAIGTITAPARRPAAIGAWTGLLLLGFSIGPLFGGAVTHAIGWRWIFGINVVLMLAAIAGFAAGARLRTPLEGSRRAPTGPGSACSRSSWSRSSSACTPCPRRGRRRLHLSVSRWPPLPRWRSWSGDARPRSSHSASSCGDASPSASRWARWRCSAS